ncbi:MAG: substrate-binding domain-containing protein [Rhizobiales bacterium]|nr:substrate-binding domain-containing protein [Hyphomicrobiales bacterium]
MPTAVTITSIAGGAPKPVFDRLRPVYERQSGNTLNALYDSMSGIAGRVAAHEALDVLLMPVATIENYIKQGVVQGACTPLANIGLAVGVTAGHPVPDVSTPEALRAALKAARGVVHAPPTATPSGAQSDKVIKTLRLAEALAGRVTHKVGLAGGLAMIASGEATLGIFPKSEIVSVPGIALAGPLPGALQLTISYGAGVTAASKVAGQAAEFVRFLIESDSRKVWTACGFDPL